MSFVCFILDFLYVYLTFSEKVGDTIGHSLIFRYEYMRLPVLFSFNLCFHDITIVYPIYLFTP